MPTPKISVVLTVMSLLGCLGCADKVISSSTEETTVTAPGGTTTITTRQKVTEGGVPDTGATLKKPPL